MEGKTGFGVFIHVYVLYLLNHTLYTKSNTKYPSSSSYLLHFPIGFIDYQLCLWHKKERPKPLFDHMDKQKNQTRCSHRRSSHKTSAMPLTMRSTIFSPFSRDASHALPMTPFSVWASMRWKVLSVPSSSASSG